MTTEEQLAQLNSQINSMLELQKLSLALDASKYLTIKLRAGEAIHDVGTYYQLVVAGGTFSISAQNPQNYVWIPNFEFLRVSQAGVFEITVMRDDVITPFLYIPRAADGEWDWMKIMPFTYIVKEIAAVTYTNHDVADQWLIAGWAGVYLRKDVYERDFPIIDAIAKRHALGAT